MVDYLLMDMDNNPHLCHYSGVHAGACIPGIGCDPDSRSCGQNCNEGWSWTRPGPHTPLLSSPPSVPRGPD